MRVGEAKAIVGGIKHSLADSEVFKSKVASAFAVLDKDNSGSLDKEESKQLVRDLCGMMNLPCPTESEFDSHVKYLDKDSDGKLSADEVGGGIAGALNFKAQTLEHYLSFAERDALGDDAELPLQ